jgi:type III restriction enzyme
MALGEAFAGKIRVFDIADFVDIRPQDIAQYCCVVIGTMQTLKVSSTEGRRVYAHNENLEDHFTSKAKATPGLELIEMGLPGAGSVKFSFANLLKVQRPLVIVDEAQHFVTGLSELVRQRIDPSAVVELQPPLIRQAMFHIVRRRQN